MWERATAEGWALEVPPHNSSQATGTLGECDVDDNCVVKSQSGLCTEKVLIPLPTFVLWWIFLNSSLWTRDDRNNLPNSLVFPFCLLFCFLSCLTKLDTVCPSCLLIYSQI